MSPPSAQVALRLQVACRGVKLEFAQGHGAVCLRICRIDCTARRNLTRYTLCRRDQRELCAHHDGLHVAFHPIGIGNAVEACIQPEAQKGRLAHHVHQGIERYALELRCDLAVDGNGNYVWIGRRRMTGPCR